MNDLDDKLAMAARGLATEIVPQRDLWPGIEEAINRPKRSRWTPMLAQAAAVVLLVGASSMVTYVVVKYDDANTPPQTIVQLAPSNLVFEQAAFGPGHTLDALYGRAGGNVESNLDREIKKLSPEARDDINRNLAVMRQAIDNISAALEKEPNNVFLQELLVEAYGNELAMMNRVGTMTQRVMARKDI
jgi:cytochrome c biogenesis factor